MRIGYFVPSIPSYSETFFQSKIKGLVKNGHKVYLFPANRKKTGNYYCGATIIRPHHVFQMGVFRIILMFIIIPYTFFKHPFKSFRFIGLELQSRRSIIHILKNLYLNAHVFDIGLDWIHFGFATLGIGRENLGLTCKAKLSASIRGYDISIFPLKHKNCYALLWNRLDKLHTLSDDLLTKAKSSGFPKGILVEKIAPAINSSNFEIRNLNFKEKMRIVTTARLHWKKGLVYTLLALEILHKKFKLDFHYTILGTGDEEERIRFFIYTLGLNDQVSVIGKVDHKDLPDILRNHHIYVQYSIQEGFCNSVLEAQSCGLLTVVSNAEGLSENVQDGLTGWVVKSRSPACLAEKIHEVCLLPDQVKKEFASRASERVKKYFNLNIQELKFNSFFS